MKFKLLAVLVICLGMISYNIYANTCERLIGGDMAETNEERIVRAQLEAYNNKDVQGCLQYFSDDLKVVALPDEKIIANSKDEIRQHVLDQIESGQFLPATLVDIRSNGPFVMTTEVKDNGKKKATISFIYYVEDGLIRKMWGGVYSE